MPTARFTVPSTPSIVSASRRRVLADIRSWGIRLSGDQEHDAALVLSELVTNAVVHAKGSCVTVQIRARRSRLLIAVFDSSRRMPVTSEADETGISGRGLFLVSALASRHGSRRTLRGKKTWAVLDVSGLRDEADDGSEAHRSLSRPIVSAR